MTNVNNSPKIFISYCWADEDIVNKIDNDFKSMGINLIRDIRDAKNYTSIKDFMKKISKTDFVILVVSKHYMKSANCMYEILELIKKDNYKETIIPIILKNEDFNIYSGSGIDAIDKYKSYWKVEYDRIDEKCKEIPLDEKSEIAEQLGIIRSIKISISPFIIALNDLISPSLEELIKTSYKAILDKIGFSEKASDSLLNKYHQSEYSQFLYITALTLVACLGGLLFGYETAVINGAVKYIYNYFFPSTATFENTLNLIAIIGQFKVMMTIVISFICLLISGQIIKLLGIKKGGIIGGIIITVLSVWIFYFLRKHASSDIGQIGNVIDTIKGFVSSSALVGCIIGGVLAGFISKSLGRRNGLFIAAIAFFISSIGSWKPELFNIFGTLPVYSFVIYRIIGGIGVGIASMISPMYIAEIAPANERGRLVSWNQFAIIFGMLIIYLVNYIIANQGNEEWLINCGWRRMFLSGVIPSSIFFFLLFFIPETPRYSVMKGRNDKALETLNKIDRNKASLILEEIKGTIHEKNAPWLSFGFLVILIGVMISIFQQFIGINVVLYYTCYIFQNKEESNLLPFLKTIIVGTIHLLFTVFAIITVDKFGRKPLMIIGASGMAISMIIFGFLLFFKSDGLISFMFLLTYVMFFAIGWGPVTWVLLTEIFPNSIRGAMSMAVAIQWIANWIISFTFPIMYNNEWLTSKFNHGFSFWIYGVMGILAAIFIWNFVPETKGKTLEEMENIWTSKRRLKNEKSQLFNISNYSGIQ